MATDARDLPPEQTPQPKPQPERLSDRRNPFAGFPEPSLDGEVPMTEEEFLWVREYSDLPLEWWDGTCYFRFWDDQNLRGMSSGTVRHAFVIDNTYGALFRLINDGDVCRAYGSNLDIRITKDDGSRGFVTPDASIVCGEPVIYDGKEIGNPTVVFEVLSRSTHGRDRGDKLRLYLRNDSIQAVVLIDPQRIQVEVCTKLDDGVGFSVRIFSDFDDIVRLPGAEVDLPLRDIYRRVDFEPETPETERPSG